ncbi:Mg2+ and Co2+ transporter CorB [Legionella parisiensis]|uniref:Magnesium and cobalt efflux protein CorC n=2 Tax=Legionella parisiensis TaxID=45071 RepID=A0A1E5JWE9_9GAMM|nr:Mg2+ and Co2+ transporter CorB [Legionella parisiensis]OEH48856.1 Magnesium and cobalt efflux protein CorC [Legionella parisiensis]STX75879.1 Mg2 and Co2 transporter [Legionella parisiensis]
MYLSENPNEFLSTIQIGITSIGILNGIIGENAYAEPLSKWFTSLGMAPPIATIIATSFIVILLTYITIVIGELVPKRLSQIHPEPIAVFFARPMYVLSLIAKPFVALLAYSTLLLLTLLRVKQTNEQNITEEELQLLLEEGRGAGVITPQEHQMVRNVFLMDDRPISSLMVPRTDIVYLDLKKPLEDNLKLMDESHHTRFPVCYGGVDKLLGIIHAKKVLSQLLKQETPNLNADLQEPIYVLKSLTGLELLKQFKTAKVQLVFVIDEYGDILGMLTLQDLMVAITGQLQIETIEDSWALQREDGSWLLDGLIPLPELKNCLQLTYLPPGALHQYHTLNGMLIFLLERFPHLGDKIEWEHWIFEIVDMDGNHADKILASKIKMKGVLK